MLFSIHMLDDVIPKRHKECFRKFVFACQYICKRIISENDITIAHGLLIQFFKDFEILYVKEKVTSNMHLHLHLKDFLLDFGPIYSFWLFSFERYNGMLGNLPNSKRNIELQIMRRFCTENIIMNQENPQTHEQVFGALLAKIDETGAPRGTLLEIEVRNLIDIAKLSSR